MTNKNNWISSFKNWAEETTDAPDLFLETSALMILSAIINRNIFITFSHDKIYPSLWILLIAKSTTYRKTTCIKLVNKFIRCVKPDMIVEQEASSEYFVDVLAEKERVTLIQDEFIGFMNSLNKEYASSIKKLLIELFDNEMPWSRGTRGGGQVEINNPFINLLSGVTPAGFQNSIKEPDVKTGFLSRWLMVYAKKKERSIRGIPSFGNEKKRESLVETLDMISKITYQARLSEEAIECFSDFQEHLEREASKKGDVVGSFNSRLIIYSLKLALLYHVSDIERVVDEVISVEDMQQSVDFAKKISEGQEYVLSNLAFSPYQLKRQKVLDLLEFADKEGIMYSDLLRKLQMPTKELMVIVDSLQIEEVVVMQQKKGIGKKPGNWLCLAEHKPKED